MSTKLIGPFNQILPMDGLPLKGPIPDGQLQVIVTGGVLVSGSRIKAVGRFEDLKHIYPNAEIAWIETPATLLPGFIDCHTHICYGGSRAGDYALRVAGKSYLEIARAGGGIWSTVTQTRLSDEEELADGLIQRMVRMESMGTTTMEVKSGYGLSLTEELKLLRTIKQTNEETDADLISTCLAAHIVPADFNGNEREYLDLILHEMAPIIRKEKLSKRMDIFVEETAFSVENARYFLGEAKAMGFDLTLHADQFSTGGSALAVALGAVSADHLEASTQREIDLLAASETVAVVLPGASLGLGMPFAPARKLLDAGACVAIASDYNPGSAPMGNLLTEAAILGAYEKLSIAETLAGMTFRAAKALALTDRGSLKAGALADMQLYPTADYREIIYHQGFMAPQQLWKKGKRLF